MKIEIIPFAAAINPQSSLNKTLVVIDVLRATSVMITALHQGAKEIIPVSSIEEAEKKSKEYSTNSSLLCGERDAKKIKGFDLGNSPLEFTNEKVSQKTIILTTTNGTKALRLTEGAKCVYIGAFINMDALIEKIKNLDKLVLVCSGTNGKFSMDDAMCAAMIIDKLSKTRDIEADDLGQLMLSHFISANGNLTTLLKNCYHYNYLNDNGHRKDVDYCLEVNFINSVPVYNDGIVYI